MLEVINVKVANLRKNGYADFADWVKEKNHLYIGRNMNFYVKGALKSKWANPFKVKKGDPNSLDDVLTKYEDYIRKSDLYNQLEELDNLVLGCWCKPSKCHGDVLIKLLKEKQNALKEESVQKKIQKEKKECDEAACENKKKLLIGNVVCSK